MSSQESLPWSTRMARAVAVKALLSEPMGKPVWASTGAAVPSRRTP